MRRHLIALLLAAALLGVGAATAAADDSDADPAAAVDFQPPAANWLAPWCRYHDEAVFYSLSWGRLAQFLAAERPVCAHDSTLKRVQSKRSSLSPPKTIRTPTYCFALTVTVSLSSFTQSYGYKPSVTCVL